MSSQVPKSAKRLSVVPPSSRSGLRQADAGSSHMHRIAGPDLNHAPIKCSRSLPALSLLSTPPSPPSFLPALDYLFLRPLLPSKMLASLLTITALVASVLADGGYGGGFGKGGGEFGVAPRVESHLPAQLTLLRSRGAAQQATATADLAQSRSVSRRRRRRTSASRSRKSATATCTPMRVSFLPHPPPNATGLLD